MRSFLSLLLLFLPIAAFAGNGSGNVSNVISLGTYPTGSVATKSLSSGDIKNHFTLVMSTTSGTNTGYYKFVKMGSQATSGEQYQVTAGKTAYCQPTISAPSAIAFNYGYGTAAIASEGTTTPPTGVKQYAGSTTGQQVNGLAASVPFPLGISVQFPASSYPFVFGSAISATAFAVWMNCQEITD